MRIGTWVAVVITSLVQLLVSPSAFGKPRIPQPPWPEQILQRWDFDAAFWTGYGGGDTSTIDFTGLAEGWSGFALQRDGLTTSPFILPGVDNGHANFTSGAGALRFWFSPAWSSTSMNGNGPGHYARLAECVVADGQSGTTAWSLYVNSNATTIYLSGQGTNGATDFLEADISWEAGRWYLLTVNYSTNGIALFINSELVAEGAALPAFNPVLAGLAIGSDWTGADLAGGLFDEVTTFAKPIKSDDLAFYYEGTSGMAALGPISAEEVAAQAAHRAEMKAKKEAEGEGGGMEMMRFASSEPSGVCVTNGPVYLTNIVCYFTTNQNWTVSFDIAGGTNGVPYDIFTTTNLIGGHITNAVWEWDDVGYTCNTYTFTNQPTNQTFYILGTTNDTDADGLTDAFEQLVSKTLISTNDTDGDLMPDKWEWDNHLNPLVNDATDDPDGDNVTNLGEYNSGTNSTNPHDEWLVLWGLNSSGQCTPPNGLSRVLALGAGLFHSAAVRTDGSVVAWGDNGHGQTNVPTGLSNVTAIAAGAYHTLALRADGSVTNWGSWFDIAYHAATSPTLTNVISVAAGTVHDLALLADGTVSAWGYASYAFTTVPTNLNFVEAVAAGWNHSVALKKDGTVVAWGDATHGATNVPVGLSNVTMIAAGAHHTLALRTDGTVVAWGAGQTNTGLFYDQGQSIVPAGLSNVLAVAAGGYDSMALLSNRTVVVWGDNGASQTNVPVGLSNVVAMATGGEHCMVMRTGRQTPVILAQPASQCVSAGDTVYFGAALSGSPAIRYQWQFNSTNLTGATNLVLALTNVQPPQIGGYRLVATNGAGAITTAVAQLTLAQPVVLSGTTPGEFTLPYGSSVTLSASAVSCNATLSYEWYFNGTLIPEQTTRTNYTLLAGNPNESSYFGPGTNLARDGIYTLAITNAAGSTNVSWTIHVVAEGANVRWGEGTTNAWDYLTNVTDFSRVDAGEFHCVGVREDGSVTQWGYEWAAVPTDLTNAVAVSAGAAHTLALRENGTVTAWGDTTYANSVPTNNYGLKAISAGTYHNVALLTNGHVVAWGANGADLGWHLTEVPADLTNATSVSAGVYHSLALRSDGTVAAWGYYASGQTNVPTGLSNIVAIAAGGKHSLALKSDGTVTAWGENTSGQCYVPAGLSNVMAIAAGWEHSVALKNDGKIVAWGSNSDGQTNVPPWLALVKLISADGNQTLVNMFSPLTQYPVDVTQDLLLIYNTNSADSVIVKDYYLQHRPMVGNANVLGIGGPTNDTCLPDEFTTNCAELVIDWLTNNPTKHPQYVVLFSGIPERVNADSISNSSAGIRPSFSFQLHTTFPGIKPFVTHINMGDTNACQAYIDKLEFFGTNYSPGHLIISAGAYGNTNYYIDNVRHGSGFPDDYTLSGSVLSVTTNSLIEAGVSTGAIIYADGLVTAALVGTNVVITHPPYLSLGTNVAGYIGWGQHADLGGSYPVNGAVTFSGNSSWYIIQTVESNNGQRYQTQQGNFIRWFSPNAFGGTNYSNTPVGAVTHVDEPHGAGNDPAKYFGLWAAKKNFAICAWNSAKILPALPPPPQVVGDPFVTK